MRSPRRLCFGCGWVLVLSAVLWACPLMDLTFVYQGRLYDANSPADGLYDLEFWVVDAADPEDPIVISYPIRFHEHLISNGYLTVPLDFCPKEPLEEEDLLDGSDRWLKIGIRLGDLEDPNEYTYLEPFPKITAAPYAHTAHRVEPPETLAAELTEPVLHVINEGTGPAIASGGDLYFYEFEAAGTDENRIEFEGNGTLDVTNDLTVEVGHNRQTTILNNDVTNISTSLTTVIGNTRSTTIGTNDQTYAGGTSTLTAGLDNTLVAGRDVRMEGNRNVVLQATGEIQALSAARFLSDDPNAAVCIDKGLYMKGQLPVDYVPGYGTLFVVDGKLYYRYGPSPDEIQLVAPKPEVYFTVRRDTSYNWPSNGSPATIDFTTGSTVLANAGGGFEGKSGVFIAPADGIYTFDGVLGLSGLSKGDMFYVEIVTGGAACRGDMGYAQGAEEALQVHITVHLAEGQTAFLRGYVNAASPPAQVIGSLTMLTYFNGARVD